MHLLACAPTLAHLNTRSHVRNVYVADYFGPDTKNQKFHVKNFHVLLLVVLHIKTGDPHYIASTRKRIRETKLTGKEKKVLVMEDMTKLWRKS